MTANSYVLFLKQWLSRAADDSLGACVDVQRTALDGEGAFDVLVGSSWGGAVAAAHQSWLSADS